MRMSHDFVNENQKDFILRCALDGRYIVFLIFLNIFLII